jgi:hypothetical protein
MLWKEPVLLAQDFGELIAFPLLYLVPIAIISVGYLQSQGQDRRNTEAIGLGCAALAFCGIILDFVHAEVYKTYGKGDAVLSLLEDGGELLSMTLILVIMMRVFQLVRAETQNLPLLPLPRTGAADL